MTLINKILIIAGSIIVVCLASLLIYNQFQIIEQQNAIQTQMLKQKEFQDNIVRSLNEYATRKDIEEFAKKNNLSLKQIEDDLNNLNARLVSITLISTTNTPSPKVNQPSSSVGDLNPNPKPPTVNCNGQEIPCPNADPYNYLKQEQKYVLQEPFGNIKVPVGTVGFSAWKPNPWSENIYKREYKVINVVGVDENQRQYVYSKFSIISNNKTYDLKIDKSETKQEFPMAKFHWWNPRLFMGADAGVDLNNVKGDFAPNLTIGILSYGKFKTQPDLSLLQLGVGYSTLSRNAKIIINPVSYNIGKHLPLTNNLYFGPSVHIGISGNVSAMIGIKAAL